MSDVISEKERVLFNQLFNSSLKRNIFGIYFLTLKHVIQNSEFNGELFKELHRVAGSKGIVTNSQVQSLKSSLKGESTLNLLLFYRILRPLGEDVEFPTEKQSVDEWLTSVEKFELAVGIEFDDDKFQRPSGGLAITLGAFVTLLKRWEEEIVPQPKVQKAFDEMAALPSRLNPHKLIQIFFKVDSDNSSRKSDAVYMLNDQVVDFLSKYHPSPGSKSSASDGQLFMELVLAGLKLNSILRRSTKIKSKAKEKLKALSPDILHRNVIELTERILARELVLKSLVGLFDRWGSKDAYLTKLRILSDSGGLVRQLVRDSEQGRIPIPKVFEQIDSVADPTIINGDWMVAVSRLFTAYHLSNTVVVGSKSAEFLFKAELGAILMEKLYEWLHVASNGQTIDYFLDLLDESRTLVDFYSQQALGEISSRFQ